MKNTENTMPARDPAYHETKRHSDMMFAYNVYPCTIPTDFSFVPLHWHDNMEIIYIKRGNGLVQVDFETFSAGSGDIFPVLPGHLHGLRSIPGQHMEYENIIFDMNFLGSENVDLCSQKYLRPILNEKIKIPPHIGRNDEQYGAAAACLDAADRLCALRPTGYELGVKGHLMLFFSMLVQMSAPGDINPAVSAAQKNMQKLKTVLSRIEQDYPQKLTIGIMADECGYSASHFMRWFKEVTGTGFNGYLIEYRLNRAALALRNTGTSILEIAEQTGFENLSNFNRLFKKKFEMTPGQFRKQEF